MSISGKSSLSIRKKDLQTQKQQPFAVKKLSFAHKASVGETSIDLTSLTLPSEMPSFSQPTTAEILNSKLFTNRKNLTLISSARGTLIQDLSYVVNSNSTITFTDSFGTTLDEEIFVGTYDPVVKSGTLVADVSHVLTTGTLTASTTDFNVGKSFKTNDNANEQVGAVTVYLDGQLMFRNVGNATASPSADGNYEEVDNGFGNSTLIRFNVTDPSARAVTVVSTALMTVRPDGSFADELEKQQGVVDKLVETTAVLAGVPETNFQATPTQPQLTQFGDRVLGVEQNLLQDPTDASQGPLLANSSINGALKKNRWQKIALAGTGITPDIAVATFNNLEIGKQYEVIYQGLIEVRDAEPALYLIVRHDGNTLSQSGVHLSAATVGQTRFTSSIIFEATTDVLTIETNGVSTVSKLIASAVSSYAILIVGNDLEPETAAFT